MSQANSSPGTGRAVLLLIAGIPLTMILAASWLWYFVVEGDLDLVGTLGTANHGTLVQPPRQLADMPFADDAGARFSWTDVEPRWTMLVVNRGSVCDRDCERRLYTTRQIHIALGKEFNRVRRVMLSDQPVGDVRVELPAVATDGVPEGAPSDLSGFIGAAHNGLLPLSATPDVVVEIASEWDENPAQWYLVDPAGWVMMRFSDDMSYKDIIKDLKFLLKNSGG
ncbi:MAG: hypothetical protein V2I45_01725 [Halieaceae bacterium]|jgi:hypothetical protein|nr:hypothetical protein [Halieaceae bacterium]